MTQVSFVLFSDFNKQSTILLSGFPKAKAGSPENKTMQLRTMPDPAEAIALFSVAILFP